MEVLVYVHREFSYESVGERILKIGPHLPKVLRNIKLMQLLEGALNNEDKMREWKCRTASRVWKHISSHLISIYF